MQNNMVTVFVYLPFAVALEFEGKFTIFRVRQFSKVRQVRWENEMMTLRRPVLCVVTVSKLL